MDRPRVFHPPLAAGIATLSAEESRHLVTVLRRGVGHGVSLFDGRGRVAEGRIIAIKRDGVEVDVGRVEPVEDACRLRLTLAVAMPRKQRQAFLFEKCTELGVHAFVPTRYERSVVKPGGEQRVKWRRTTIEAAKQCGRDWLPIVKDPRSFAETIDCVGEFDWCLVADAEAGLPTFAELLNGSGPGRRNILIWIGPEGGLTDAERELATESGGRRVSLAKHTLRIETAALAAAAVIHHYEQSSQP